MARRRGNGDGSVRKRPNGLWEARATLPDGTRRSFYGDTRQEAANKLRDALHDVSKGIPLVDERQTVKQYLTSWYEGMQPQVRPSSYRRYGDYIKHLMPGI